MAKILKLGFAMGGGVSLGTFSGAALSETIKQAILQGGYYEQQGSEEIFIKYDKVIIDVFAGASAGSMSLSIMLRGLCHQSEEELEKARATLIADTSIDFEKLGVEVQNDLIVAQVVQDLQEEIWINEINIDKLLGATPEEQAELIYNGGLLRNKALEDIAKKYFQMDEAFSNGFANRRVLSNEVIFGSSLTNLTGLKLDSRKGNPVNDPNYAASADAFSSRSHKEFRVFHLFFDEKNKKLVKDNPEEFPPKWLRYHNGATKKNYFGSLAEKKTWSRIVATSVACGAFPFAFEPVPLERFEFEFEQWPTALTAEVCEKATGRKGQLSYPFSYIDGGTFNNEPVREAFRMASFLDAKDDPESFDRLIVFVDPSIASETVDFRVPVHQRYSVKKPRKIFGVLDGYDLVNRSTLDRLVPHIGTLLSVIIDEGRVNENDKLGYISDLFATKIKYNLILEQIIDHSTVKPDVIDKIKDELIKLIRLDRLNELLPVGALTLEGELLRVINDNKKDFLIIRNLVSDFIEKGSAGILVKFHKSFLKALFTVFIDRLLNLTGKSKESKIMAIAPVNFIKGKMEIQTLPGDYLFGFAGFTSKLPNIFEASLAKYSTLIFMKELKLIAEDRPISQPPVWKDQVEFAKEYMFKLRDIEARIDNLFMNSKFIDILPLVDQFVLTNLSKAVKNALEDVDLFNDPFYSFVFKIPVSRKNMEIDGAGIYNDASAIKVDGEWFLITELYYFYQPLNARWSGVHIQNDSLIIGTDGFGVLPDARFCSIELPNVAAIELANMMPNPTFEYRAITEKDKGKVLPGTGWEVSPGIIRIDECLLD